MSSFCWEHLRLKLRCAVSEAEAEAQKRPWPHGLLAASTPQRQVPDSDPDDIDAEELLRNNGVAGQEEALGDDDDGDDTDE